MLKIKLFFEMTKIWMEPMKVLVTGGAGFIGSNLARALWRQGLQVVVIDNLLSGFKQNLSGMPEIYFI